MTVYVEPESPGGQTDQNGGSTGTKANETTTGGSNSTDQNVNYSSYTYTEPSSSPTAAGTTIVVIITALIVIIPIGFLVSCIVRKIKERREKGKENLDMQRIPDHTDMNQASPDILHTNMYPYGGGPGD